MREFFSEIIKNGVQCFSGRNLVWHLLAIGLTFLLVISGFDWSYFLFIQGLSLSSWFFPALALGGLLPLFLPLGLFLFGRLRKNERIKQTGLAVAQAAILGSFISSWYKAFTGRVHPPHLAADSIILDISQQFRFGFWRGGIFWGWPSSHTTIAFAMAVTIFVLFPKQKVLRFLALIYAGYIGLGVLTTSIHWFSEVVAGVIIGSVIGVMVGKYFQKKIVF